MKIQIKNITLENFKGGSISIDFSPSVTNIFGANEAGKTRVFDAFTWLFWGKDSSGSELGDKVKPLDSDNNVKRKLTTSVEAALSINGKPLTLRREYMENWVKRRGSTEQEMDGHTSQFYIAGVKVQKQDYDKQVSEICDEQTFKMLTNPAVFPSMHWEEQRKILFTLAGSMEPYEICKDHKDIIELLDRMGKLKSKEYKERLAAQKTEVNKAIADTTPRIDELVNRQYPEGDWAALEKELAGVDADIERLEGMRSSVAKQNEDANLRKSKLTEQIYQERDRLMQLQAKQKAVFYADYNNKLSEYNESYSAYIKEMQRRATWKSEFDTYAAQLETSEKGLEQLRSRYAQVAKREFAGLPEGADTCTTCGQSLPASTIEDLNAKALTTFNVNKEKELKQIAEDGNTLKENIASLRSKIEMMTDSIGLDITEPEKPEQPVYTPKETEEMVEANNRITTLQVECESIATTPDEDLKRQLLEQRRNRDTLLSSLHVRKAIEDNNKRIQELKSLLKSNAQRKADIEKEEDLLAKYNRIMVDYMENKVSGMFSFVKFKLFRKLVNNSEEPTCELLVKGVPYSIVNTAGKVQAGLDVISTLQKHSDTYAPIFIDDRELITEIPDMDCQVINLYVSPQDKQLRITQ